MRHLPVHWFEGMFLRPQHFQAADRYWDELLSTSGSWENPYNYGLWHVEISREALANYQLQLVGCQARLPDGTIFSLGEGRESDRVDLKEAFARESQVTAYLAVPRRVMGRANVAQADDAVARQRFRETTESVQDESVGGNDQEIQFLDLNVRVLLSTDDHSGYTTLPIARIKRVGSEEATPELDDEYFPPALAISAWEPLGLGTVRAIYDMVGEKIEVLGQRASERRITFSSQQPGDVDDLVMLMSLTEVQAVLQCLTFAQGVHPFLAYRELCRLVGRLTVFGEERRLEGLPAYDHDDLARIFRWIRVRLEALLGSRQRLQYEQRYFVGAERGMEVAIEPQWFHSNWRWYVGVYGQNVSEAECRELLRPGKLDWKMGSSQQIDMIFRYGLPGLEQSDLSHPPRALPPHGWVYYEIQRQNNAWKDVLATQTLSLRLKEELIGNLDKLRGQRRIEVVLPNKSAVLEFALFAVPVVAGATAGTD